MIELDTLLAESTMQELTELRHQLHANPELSGEETGTAAILRDYLSGLNPDEIIEGIAGSGLAVVFKGSEPGPTVLFRAELDALPIQELNRVEYASKNNGVSHCCGHDGHMATLAALANSLDDRPPKRGCVVLLFQPAEETGSGAEEVTEDELFKAIAPDYAFAFHNIPGFPMGRVLVRPGTMNCASRGLVIRMCGKVSHAAHPEDGINPTQAMCQIIQGLCRLSAPNANPLQLVTVVHAHLGEEAFGTAPGEAVVMATLRAETDEAMESLVERAMVMVKDHAGAAGLEYGITWKDVFSANVNNNEATERIIRAANGQGVEIRILKRPLRWSEDFGAISQTCKGAMFGLGSGEFSPQLHNPDYNFPDELIAIGAVVFHRLVSDLLNNP